MVLWEITVATAYFLGLKRTYKLALKIQRRLISPKYPKIRQFAQRRTRAAFDVALMVHRNIQQRDLVVGRSVGNWILRWLDKMKPSAEIRGPPDGNFTPKRNAKVNTRRLPANSPHDKKPGDFHKFSTGVNRYSSSRHLFALSNFSGIAMMLRASNGSNIQCRRMSFSGPGELRWSCNNRVTCQGVIRKDIMQWMLQSS